MVIVGLMIPVDASKDVQYVNSSLGIKARRFKQKACFWESLTEPWETSIKYLTSVGRGALR